jgi:hypothetical protein
VISLVAGGGTTLSYMLRSALCSTSSEPLALPRWDALDGEIWDARCTLDCPGNALDTETVCHHNRCEHALMGNHWRAAAALHASMEHDARTAALHDVSSKPPRPPARRPPERGIRKGGIREKG